MLKSQIEYCHLSSSLLNFYILNFHFFHNNHSVLTVYVGLRRLPGLPKGFSISCNKLLYHVIAFHIALWVVASYSGTDTGWDSISISVSLLGVWLELKSQVLIQSTQYLKYICWWMDLYWAVWKNKWAYMWKFLVNNKVVCKD